MNATEQARQAVGSSQKGESGSKLPEMFAGYQFTGNLRPGIVGPRRQVPDHIPRPDYALNAHGTPKHPHYTTTIYMQCTYEVEASVSEEKKCWRLQPRERKEGKGKRETVCVCVV